MPKRKSFSALDIIKRAISENVREGDICIDATAGRGNDTLFMASLVGDSGHVTAFDIQSEAVESTKALLENEGLSHRADVRLQSHAEMDTLFEEGTVSCITFNFGWLPKGDHSISTKKESSLEAIEKGLRLLKKDGIMTLIIYYGRDTGFEEKDAILEYLPTIDSGKYTVLEMPFVNRPNCPPIPIIIFRDE
ncbi:MAG: class I SAM-dependent methyltransferase [Oscillospiraceae bacterium]|nr:class I SAM-dependent methyltransferase [Oscillospiraceae bacterium]MDY2847261.1 class I SAM-dependent methyltransferase [Oscillospiraceae bacterium]